jgi:hypothetical protein
MDAMAAIGKVLKEARSRLLFVDNLDHTVLTDFAAMAAEGVKIDLLADSFHRRRWRHSRRRHIDGVPNMEPDDP